MSNAGSASFYCYILSPCHCVSCAFACKIWDEPMIALWKDLLQDSYDKLVSVMEVMTDKFGNKRVYFPKLMMPQTFEKGKHPAAKMLLYCTTQMGHELLEQCQLPGRARFPKGKLAASTWHVVEHAFYD